MAADNGLMSYEKQEFWNNMFKLVQEMGRAPALRRRFQQEPGSSLQERSMDMTFFQPDGEVRFTEYLTAVPFEERRNVANEIMDQAMLPLGEQTFGVPETLTAAQIHVAARRNAELAAQGSGRYPVQRTNDELRKATVAQPVRPENRPSQDAVLRPREPQPIYDEDEPEESAPRRKGKKGERDGKKRLIWILVPVILLAALFGAYLGWSGIVTKKASKVVFDAPEEMEIELEKTQPIPAVITPQNAKVRYEVTDGTCVEIQDGYITATEPGDAVIGMTAVYPRLARLGGKLLGNRPAHATLTVHVTCDYSISYRENPVKLQPGDRYIIDEGKIQVTPEADADDMDFTYEVIGDAITLQGNTIVAQAVGEAEVVIKGVIRKEPTSCRFKVVVGEPEPSPSPSEEAEPSPSPSPSPSPTPTKTPTPTPTPTKTAAPTPTPTPHKHVYDVKVGEELPTCEKDGWIDYKCSCGAVERTTIDALGHQWAQTAHEDPTCTAAGYTDYACSRDGCDATKHEDIPALGHDWVQQEDGSYKCSRCPETKPAENSGN